MLLYLLLLTQSPSPLSRLLAAATPSIPEEPSQLSSPGAPLKRQTSAIPEGDNEDGEEEDLDGFPEDDEPAVSCKHN